MHIITKKVRLIPASIWSGIRLTIEVPDDDPTWGIFASTAPAKSDINVEWGDGTSDHFTGSIRQETHTYPQGGRYFVTISDVITMLVISNANSDSPFHAKYAPRIIHFEAENATPLSIGVHCFNGAANLAVADLKNGVINGLMGNCFANCPKLAGRLDFQSVTSIPALPFTDSPLVSEIHFSEANKGKVMESAGYKADPNHLGTVNAQISFDP